MAPRTARSAFYRAGIGANIAQSPLLPSVSLSPSECSGIFRSHLLSYTNEDAANTKSSS